jgi:hypothetical protein
LIAYDIYRFRNQFGKIPGVLGRSEFGIEIASRSTASLTRPQLGVRIRIKVECCALVAISGVVDFGGMNSCVQRANRGIRMGTYALRIIWLWNAVDSDFVSWGLIQNRAMQNYWTQEPMPQKNPTSWMDP